MYFIALFSFGTAAILGILMAVLHFRGETSGKALGLAHGLFALSGIVLLSVGLAKLNAGAAWWLVAGFALVALGGAYLFSRQMKGEPWPGLVIAVHGGLALVMIVVLGLWLADRPEPESEDGSVPATTGQAALSPTAA